MQKLYLKIVLDGKNFNINITNHAQAVVEHNIVHGNGLAGIAGDGIGVAIDASHNDIFNAVLY